MQWGLCRTNNILPCGTNVHMHISSWALETTTKYIRKKIITLPVLSIICDHEEATLRIDNIFTEASKEFPFRTSTDTFRKAKIRPSLIVSVNRFMYPHTYVHVGHRGYYMPARGYEFYLRVVNSISHEWAQRTSEISSWPREDKIHIHKRACNILFII